MDSTFTSKLVAVVKQEIEKAENKQHLQACVIDPMVVYIIQQVQPYFIVGLIVLLIILLSNSYIIFKLHNT